MIMTFKICNDRCTANGHIKGGVGKEVHTVSANDWQQSPNLYQAVTVQQIRKRAGMLLGNPEILLQFY